VPRRPGIYRNLFKRGFDLLFILVTSVAVLPLILLLAAFVARDGHKPFYSSPRVGRHGREFQMLKLRTMVPNADAQLERYLAENPEARREWESTQKLKNDPRITRFGRFLRKSSLDELPQLWNVLLGDMSIVGPRPMMPAQRARYMGLAYYALRPGLTGPWQVSVRNESSFAQRAEFDRQYDQRVTFFGDLGLILRTLYVVMRGTGY
jgi:lipopolysaccharide/colanic/teichoic acid biosynthesis glycosyltransferase